MRVPLNTWLLHLGVPQCRCGSAMRFNRLLHLHYCLNCWWVR